MKRVKLLKIHPDLILKMIFNLGSNRYLSIKGFPKDYKIISTVYDYETGFIVFEIESPEFEPIHQYGAKPYFAPEISLNTIPT